LKLIRTSGLTPMETEGALWVTASRRPIASSCEQCAVHCHKQGQADNDVRISENKRKKIKGKLLQHGK
jgi:hypothetical protein